MRGETKWSTHVARGKLRDIGEDYSLTYNFGCCHTHSWNGKFLSEILGAWQKCPDKFQSTNFMHTSTSPIRGVRHRLLCPRMDENLSAPRKVWNSSWFKNKPCEHTSYSLKTNQGRGCEANWKLTKVCFHTKQTLLKCSQETRSGSIGVRQLQVHSLAPILPILPLSALNLNTLAPYGSYKLKHVDKLYNIKTKAIKFICTKYKDRFSNTMARLLNLLSLSRAKLIGLKMFFLIATGCRF